MALARALTLGTVAIRANERLVGGDRARRRRGALLSRDARPGAGRRSAARERRGEREPPPRVLPRWPTPRRRSLSLIAPRPGPAWAGCASRFSPGWSEASARPRSTGCSGSPCSVRRSGSRRPAPSTSPPSRRRSRAASSRAAWSWESSCSGAASGCCSPALRSSRGLRSSDRRGAPGSRSSQSAPGRSSRCRRSPTRRCRRGSSRLSRSIRGSSPTWPSWAPACSGPCSSRLAWLHVAGRLRPWPCLAGFAVPAVLAVILLPGEHAVTPVDDGLLVRFRAAAVGGQAVFWTLTGLAGLWLLEHRLGAKPAARLGIESPALADVRRPRPGAP